MKHINNQVMFISVSEMEPHPTNISVYGKDQNIDDIVSTMLENEYIKPLILVESNTKYRSNLFSKKYYIISGVRRYYAAKMCNYTHIPCMICSFEDSAEEICFFLMENSYRRKTKEQIIREYRLLIKTEKEKAKTEIIPDSRLNEMKQLSIDNLLVELGCKNDQMIYRADYIVSKIDTLINKSEDSAAEFLRDVFNNNSCTCAYKLALCNGKTISSIKERLTDTISKKVRSSDVIRLIEEHKKVNRIISNENVRINIYNSTAIEWINANMNKSIDMIFIDMEHTELNINLLKKILSIPSQPIIYIYTNKHKPLITKHLLDENIYYQELIVPYLPTRQHISTKSYITNFYDVIYINKSGRALNNIGPEGTIKVDGHSFTKPKIKDFIFKQFLINSTQIENIVLDLSMGDSIRPMTALELNRYYIGIEPDKNQYMETKSRIDNYIEQTGLDSKAI